MLCLLAPHQPTRELHPWPSRSAQSPELGLDSGARLVVCRVPFWAVFFGGGGDLLGSFFFFLGGGGLFEVCFVCFFCFLGASKRRRDSKSWGWM